MEGGVGILLLVIVVVVAGGFGIALYVTGGALWSRKTDPDAGEGEEPRPEHKRPTTPAHENTEFVGTRSDDER